MRNAGLEEAQAGIKIAGRNINMQMTPPLWEKVKLKNLLINVKEEGEKVALKFNTQKLRSWHPVLSLHGK